MKGTIFTLFICSLFLLAACGNKQAESEQSIQDIVSNKAFNNTPSVTIPTETKITPKVNETKAVVEEEVEEPVEEIGTPVFNKKCRYSTILSGGCKWTTKQETNFILKIQNGGKKTIPGVWFVYAGSNGTIKSVKRNEEILSGGIRSYDIDYAKLVEELGVISRLDIYPIEEINGSYACQNMRVYTIPEEYCKPAEASRLNDDGSISK